MKIHCRLYQMSDRCQMPIAVKKNFICFKSILKGESVGLIGVNALTWLSSCPFAPLFCVISRRPFLLKSWLEKSKMNLLSGFDMTVWVNLRLALLSPSRRSSSEVVCFLGYICVISSFRFMPMERSPEVGYGYCTKLCPNRWSVMLFCCLWLILGLLYLNKLF